VEIYARQRGGVAGNVRLECTFQTNDLPADEREDVEAEAAGLPFGQQLGPPAYPAQLRYELAVTRGDTRQVAEVTEQEMPRTLGQVVRERLRPA
jgi:hypothetical protein